MKILYITTIGGTMTFFKTIIKDLIEEGNTVDIATNEVISPVQDEYKQWGCKVFHMDWSRLPLDRGNHKAINQLKSVVVNGNYDIVHCHTPIAAAITRYACKNLRRNGLKVIYTAHGFHFYHGAPLRNWIIYYSIEKICAHWTDVLITINVEDFERAKRKLKAKRIEYVPGVGINVEKFKYTVVDKAAKRKEIGVPEDAYVILSVGELNENKNHQIVIKALGEIADSNIHYIIAGSGNQEDHLKRLAKEKNVNLHLLGYRSDVAELYKIADLYIHPSFREGLCVSIMEAAASGVPVACSRIRGNVDIIDSNLFNPTDEQEIIAVIKNPMSNNYCMSAFSVESINKKMKEIYRLI